MNYTVAVNIAFKNLRIVITASKIQSTIDLLTARTLINEDERVGTTNSIILKVISQDGLSIMIAEVILIRRSAIHTCDTFDNAILTVVTKELVCTLFVMIRCVIGFG